MNILEQQNFTHLILFPAAPKYLDYAMSGQCSETEPISWAAPPLKTQNFEQNVQSSFSFLGDKLGIGSLLPIV